MGGMMRWLCLCGIYPVDREPVVVLAIKRLVCTILMLETIVPQVIEAVGVEWCCIIQQKVITWKTQTHAIQIILCCFEEKSLKCILIGCLFLPFWRVFWVADVMLFSQIIYLLSKRQDLFAVASTLYSQFMFVGMFAQYQIYMYHSADLKRLIGDMRTWVLQRKWGQAALNICLARLRWLHVLNL